MNRTIRHFVGTKIVAFHQTYLQLTGDPISALFLSQACYWGRKSNANGGWFYKTQVEWSRELGLSRYQQEKARKKLRTFSFWKEKRQGTPAKMYFCIDYQHLETCLHNPTKFNTDKSEVQYAKNSQSSMLKTSNQVCEKLAILYNETKNTYKEQSIPTSINQDAVPSGESVQSEIILETTKTSEWNHARKKLYELLFRFYKRSKGVLIVDFIKKSSDPLEIELGSLPKITEDRFLALIKYYCKERQLKFSDILKRIDSLGSYLADRMPFQLKQKNISLDELLDRPHWFQAWMTESLQYKAFSGNVKEFISKPMPVISPEDHAFIKHTLNEMKKELRII